MKLQRLLKKNIRSIQPYNTKEIPYHVKLDANESPYSFSLSLDFLKKIPTNRYPDPDGKELKRILARRWKLKVENILLGNGSDELIYYLIITFGGPVIFPVPTFSMYGIITQALGEKFVAVPLDNSFDLDSKKMISAIKNHKPKIIFLSSPNNPTGNCFSSDRIFRIIKAFKGIIVLDEAYQPFSSKRGLLRILRDFENVVIMRTLSKVGFASLRVGFLLGQKDIIEAINRVRLPFNVNALSQAVAVNALKNYRDVENALKLISNERDKLYQELKKLKSIHPYPSKANFVLFRVKNSVQVYKKLLSKGILVKDINSMLKDCLRVTVGTPEENMLFLESLQDVIKR